jgi:hypothetical protein
MVPPEVAEQLVKTELFPTFVMPKFMMAPPVALVQLENVEEETVRLLLVLELSAPPFAP